MIYIKNEINHPTINQAAILFMRHYRDTEFLDMVRNVSKFNHTEDTGEQVAKKIEEAVMEVTIKGYRTFSPWSNVIGYAKGNTIFINTRKLDSIGVVDRCENIYHEICHVLNYSHRGNRPDKYNLGSVPYMLGAMFGRYIATKI